MLNFKKVFNFKVIAIPIAAIFLLNSIVYGIDLPQKACLRKPLDFNKLGDNARYLKILEQERADDLRLRLLNMLKPDSKALQETRKELFIIVENSREEKVFEESGSFTNKFLEYLSNLKIKEDEEGGIYKVIKTGQSNLIYLIEDINGNKFLMGKEGEFSAIMVPEKDERGGEFFVELSNAQSLQLVRALRKTLGNSRPTALDEDKFFSAAVFSARSAQGLLDTISKHPILSNIFNLIADKCSGLRLSGGFYLASQSDADGYYLNYAEWIGWRQDVKWDILESLPEAILGHEALHHLFARIFSKDEALYGRIKKHIEENHKPLLAWLKNHPSYKQGDEMHHINEALAYSFQAAIEGSLITRGGSVLRYSDLKLFKELGLLPEAYLPGKLLSAFPGDSPVQNGFFKILKVLHDTRFENSGKDLKVALQEYVSREIGEEKPDYGVLFTIGDFFSKTYDDLNDAENLYNKIIETAKDDLGIKAMAMLLGPIRFGSMKGIINDKDIKQIRKASESFLKILEQDGAVENFLRLVVSMNIRSKTLKGLLSGIDYKDMIAGESKKLEKNAEEIREKIEKTPEVTAKRISDKIALYQQLIVILHEQEISYFLLGDEEKYIGVMKEMANAYDKIEKLEILRERLLKNEYQYPVVWNLSFNSEMRAKKNKAGKRLDSLRVEELELLREKLKEAIGSDGLVDFIVEDIANQGSLYIDETGQIRGNKPILKLIAEINEISLGQLLRPVLFHEKVHDLLDRIFEKLKKPFLEGLERELSKATSDTSIGLRDDVIKTMERYFGKFGSVDKLLEDFIAKYYTYKFCGRDKDIFEREEMKKAGAVLEENMKQHFFASGAASMIKIDDKWHFISPNKKDLNVLFSIYGENTKEAQIAKLKELFIESKVLGGKSGIKFEKSEGILRLNKALGQMFLKRYPIVPVFRRMRHGGSVYDMERYVAGACEDLGQILYYGEEDLDAELKGEFENFLSALKDKYTAFQKLIREPSAGVESEIEKPVISGWEDGLKHNLEVFRKTRSDFNALVRKANQRGLNDEMKEVIGTFSEMAERGLDGCIVILTEGVNLVNGVVVKKEVNPNEIIEEAIKSHGSFMEFKKEPGLKIYADSMMVQQIITNIVFNIDNIKTEKQITKAVISARLSEDGENVIIEIIDNGLGFPEEMLSKTPGSDGSYEVIFGLNMTYRKGGSGFGLAENDFYAMLNNGSFRVFSRPSGEYRGSTFIITLPVPSKDSIDTILKSTARSGTDI